MPFSIGEFDMGRSPQLLPDEESTLFAPTDIDLAQKGIASATKISALGRERTFRSAIVMSA
jgi:hypothetical protein